MGKYSVVDGNLPAKFRFSYGAHALDDVTPCLAGQDTRGIHEIDTLICEYSMGICWVS